MKRVDRTEVLDIGAYEGIRAQFQRRVIEEKRLRRVALGSNMTALFENHDTVLYQIQEMIRTERISKKSAIEHEIETYNGLLPEGDGLSITIMIEYPDREERERMLSELAGVESRFYVVVGDEKLQVNGEPRGNADRTTAIQYTTVDLSPGAAKRLRRREGPIKLGVDHPAYRAEVELGPAVVMSLSEDLD